MTRRCGSSRRRDVAPVNFDLIPNYADVYAGPQGPVVQHRRRRRLRRPARPRREPDGVQQRRVLPKDTASWAPIWPGTDYKGKLSIYDNQIFIADAAIYLKATQPDLNITNPYELDEDQFNAAIDLLKQQRPNIGKYWDGVTYADQVDDLQVRGDRGGDDLAVPGQPHGRREAAADGHGARSQGGHDRVVGYVDDLLQGRASELHVPLDELHHLAAGEREGRRVLRRGALEREGVRRRRAIRTPARTTTRTTSPYWDNVYYWNTPAGRTAETTAATSARRTRTGVPRGRRSRARRVGLLR